ncbi:CDP-glucose 4,6-dehydratase [Aurantimonas sp. MSK8Z-1]|uniref:CDP-glucose 4,6-dehydratase n=1 Tax=Mangrovibrevibacter kandeliae TaxID=2968473 RepID=UPI00211885F8|nr:CDP-glucose 4,6-dehydratase [Aurantimonas sp. MSK8Z-1]MCW4116996.1 CDP-glucose 4,6-dehydratase [Aurantimonas sp. MSK8Z-1]
MLNAETWRGLRVTITGHTGFKGTWLTAWLQRLGATVSGYALPADATSPFDIVRPELDDQQLADIRDPQALTNFLQRVKPQLVLHLAAQPLVRLSYAEPVDTFETNVIGTARLLEAVRQTPSVRAVLVVTTDKVYENTERGVPFAEDDRLGGHDPYSASKACAELVTASYRRSFFSDADSAVVASARSGNVIGGGDWSADRIVPDIMRAMADDRPVSLRYPKSVRPWLHVLEPLAGYLVMSEAMLAGRRDLPELNFAPDPNHACEVAELVERFSRVFDGRPGWRPEAGTFLKEAGLLTLDAARAARTLGWTTRLDIDETIRWTAEWYREQARGGDVRELTFRQIERYQDLLISSLPAIAHAEYASR